MNTESLRTGHATALPAGALDFIAVDDSGEFSYFPSEGEVLAAFEYVNEASCVIDRGGAVCLCRG